MKYSAGFIAIFSVCDPQRSNNSDIKSNNYFSTMFFQTDLEGNIFDKSPFDLSFLLKILHRTQDYLIKHLTCERECKTLLLSIVNYVAVQRPNKARGGKVVGRKVGAALVRAS